MSPARLKSIDIYSLIRFRGAEIEDFCGTSQVLLLHPVFFPVRHKSARFIGADQLVALDHHQGAALFTRRLNRAVPGHETAFRAAFAAVEFSALFGLADHDLLAAYRALDTDLFQIRFRIPAFRKARTSKEFSVRTVFDDHGHATQFSGLIGLFIADFNLFQFCGRLLDCGIQIRIKVLDDGLPIHFPILDTV